MERWLALALAAKKKMEVVATETMSSAQLLGLLIGKATRKKSAEMIGLSLLEEFDGVGGLGQISFSHLRNISGISTAGASRIAAAYELVNRIMVSSRKRRRKISDALDVWNLLGHEMKFLQKEEFRVLLLGGRNELLKVKTIATGQILESGTIVRT